MELADIVKENKNFYLKDGCLYNINSDEPLYKLQKNYYENIGTYLTFYKKGVRIENNNFGRREYRFYDNGGNLLDKIKEDNPQHENELYMNVLLTGILSVTKDFSDFTVYKFTKYNGIRKYNYDIHNILEIVNKDEKEYYKSLNDDSNLTM